MEVRATGLLHDLQLKLIQFGFMGKIFNTNFTNITSSSSMAQQPDVGPWPPLSSPFIPVCLEVF
jgi:hypothetical protein